VGGVLQITEGPKGRRKPLGFWTWDARDRFVALENRSSETKITKKTKEKTKKEKKKPKKKKK